MGMRPGPWALRASMCSTQNWGPACLRIGWALHPIFPCFQPKALIGAHTHGTRCAARTGGAGLLRVPARRFLLLWGGAQREQASKVARCRRQAAGGKLRANAGQMASKWGQIKIQDDHLAEAGKCMPKFCSDPFCVRCGASNLPAQTLMHDHLTQAWRASWHCAKHPLCIT